MDLNDEDIEDESAQNQEVEPLNSETKQRPDLEQGSNEHDSTYIPVVAKKAGSPPPDFETEGRDKNVSDMSGSLLPPIIN